MLVPPDPLIEDEFNNFVHTSICSFGIHTHDKYTTGRCHKPPKGITCCALTKPSGLIDQTKPVQLIELTSQQKIHQKRSPLYTKQVKKSKVGNLQ